MDFLTQLLNKQRQRVNGANTAQAPSFVGSPPQQGAREMPPPAQGEFNSPRFGTAPPPAAMKGRFGMSAGMSQEVGRGMQDMGERMSGNPYQKMGGQIGRAGMQMRDHQPTMRQPPPPMSDQAGMGGDMMSNGPAMPEPPMRRQGPPVFGGMRGRRQGSGPVPVQKKVRDSIGAEGRKAGYTDPRDLNNMVPYFGGNN